MKESLKNAALGIGKQISEGILAGIMISLGGAVFLACNLPETPYAKYIGAFLFSLALLCICMRGYALYTGKIGLVFEAHKKSDISLLLLCLLGNAIATTAFGYLVAYVFPNLKATAETLCTAKLGQGYGFGFLRAVLCGILVYLSIDIYRNNKSVIGIVFCIPAFILSGYEHSIADMFYFATSGIVSGEAFLYLIMIVLGNSVGALLIPALRLIRPSSKPAAPAEKPAEQAEATPAEKPAEQTEATPAEKDETGETK